MINHKEEIKKMFDLLKSKQITPEEAAIILNKIKNNKDKVITIVANESEQSLETLEKGLQAEIVTIVSHLVNVSEDEVDVYSEMSEFGFDSVTIVSLTSRINSALEIDITPAVFFEHRNIDSLVKFILYTYKDKISEVKHAVLSSDVVEDNSQIEDIKNDGHSKEYIAIIGVSAVMPQSEDKEVFWDNIADGKNLVTEVPKDRWDWEKYYGNPDDGINVTNIKYGGFMKEVDMFDSLFFGISPAEAELMDPQQRIFLENVWNVIEDAGYKASELAGLNIGVYAGVGTHDYNELLTSDGQTLNAYSATGSAHSVLANRISYFFDFHGPSEPIDTACSSALVAIHHAVESLQAGDCELAIAGGVNVLLTPTLFISFSKGGMLSLDGKCKAFDKDADGYVRGEGTGVILLKPLNKAIEDGDYIYAVIKGTAINHGGKVNTLTAPNPNAQAKLIAEAWEKAQINPEQITYIETHGTGTSLGDPIEINGLKKAYKNFNEKYHIEALKNKTCGLASVKTNIGHLEAAAGIAGLIKILMAMKYEYLPPNIHFKEKNPYIQLEDSPFYIIEKGQKWESNKKVDGNPIPKLAGISSFGFGGVNAHIVLEEYIKTGTKKKEVQNKCIIVVSAHTERQLTEYAIKIKEYIKKQISRKSTSDSLLSEIAFSLQMGREEMEYRMAFVVETIATLIERLEEFIIGKHSGEIYIGSINNGKNEEVFNIDLQELESIALAWVQGKKVNWRQIYQGKKINRIPMPTYPFDKKHYWLQQNNKTKEEEVVKKLHLFLDENVSTLQEQCFKKTFSKEEFFVRSHVIGSKTVVPAAVFIEMARAACEKSIIGYKANNIQNIQWLRPLIIEEENKDVYIRLYPQNGEVKFEIGSKHGEDDFITYAKGSMLLNEPNRSNPKLDIMKLRKSCHNIISKEDCYKYFQEVGIHYGKEFKSIKELYTGDNEVFSCIELCTTDYKYADGLWLHPAVLDGVFQSVVGIYGVNLKAPINYLPFSVENISICDKVRTNCYVYSKLVKTDIDTKIYNIYVMDEEGNILVEFQNFVTKLVRSNAFESTAKKYDSMCFTNVWKERPLVVTNDVSFEEGNLLLFDIDLKLYNNLQKSIKDKGNKIFCVLKGESFKQIEESIFEINPTIEEHYIQLVRIVINNNISNVIHLWSGSDKVNNLNLSDNILLESIFSVFLFTQNFVKATKRRDIGFLYFHDIETEIYPFYEAVSSFGISLKQEHPNIKFKTVGIESNKREAEILTTIISYEKISENLVQHEVKYSGVYRYVKELKQLHFQDNMEAVKSTTFKEGASYLVTGGCGGIGFIIAKYLAKEYKANLILCGRTEIGEKIQNKLEELSALGGSSIYVNADISTEEGANCVVKVGKEHFEKINGLIHCAGIIKDAFIENKTLQDFQNVIKAKVVGTIYLDKALATEDMDTMILCSSIAATFGNVGQTDYAYANGFLDAFAAYVNRRKETIKAISIQWPLWNEIGMTISDEQKEALEQTYGLVPMEKEIGIKHLEFTAKVNIDAMIVVYGEKEHILREINPEKIIEGKNSANQIKTIKDKKELIHYLSKIISRKTKLPVSSIKEMDHFEKYGIDSILIMELNRELEKVFGVLSKTLFFEYQTIYELSNYFISNHAEKVAKILESDVSDRNLNYIKENSHKSATDTILVNKSKERFIRDISKVNTVYDNQEEIAIIGVSGRYPEAENLEDFWTNLKAGKDCITKLPLERWNDWENNSNESIYGGFLKNIDKFDPLFFNISPKEASLIDPQERLFLETVWHTLEDAGYKKGKLEKSKIGVFVGVMYGQYQLLGVEETAKGNPLAIPSFYASIANRVSYFYNFTGPSIAIDTMCSSSLTAIHLACDSLRKGESSLAIAGGVNISIHPSKYMMLAQTGFISKEGKCQSFGSKGDGYIPGEGVGAVLLKPLKMAIVDGDMIYAVIKGSTINHGGKTNGYTVPNPNAQTDLIVEALEKANISPDTLQYIEAHGTGTPLGDPIEITGLTNAMRKFTQEKQFCSIGSVKSNIGHLESAAGIASITKVLLQMKHRTLVPSIHTTVLNPNIDFQDTPFYVQKELKDWAENTNKDSVDRTYLPRRAAVSSFGAGGANAHIILEEYPQTFVGNTIHKQQYIVPISAKNVERLQEYCQSILNYIINTEELLLKDMAYTLAIGREEMEDRVVFIVSGIEDLKEKLAAFIKGEHRDNVYIGNIYKNPNVFSSILGDQDGSHIIDNWEKEQNIIKLASIWVNGMEINWRSIFTEGIYHKITMPGYPFAKESCWINRSSKIVKKSNLNEWIDKVDYLQSLKNGLILKKTFYSSDLIVKDHKVLGDYLIPGVVGIQVVRAAMECIDNLDNMILRNVVWLKPIKVDTDCKEINILIKSNNQKLDFSVYSYEAGREILHIKGEAISGKDSNLRGTQVDLEELKQTYNTHISKQDIYKYFEDSGLYYGESYQVLEEILVNEDEAFSEIKLKDSKQSFDFNPILLDGALQTMAAIYFNRKDFSRETAIPYQVEEIEVLSTIKDRAYSYVKLCDKDKFNIAIFDSNGYLCVKISGLIVKKIDVLPQNIFYMTDWRETSFVTNKSSRIQNQRAVIYTEEGIGLKEELKKYFEGDVIEIKLDKENLYVSEDKYAVNNSDEDALKAFIRQLSSIDELYFLGGIYTKAYKEDDLNELNHTQELGVFSLFRLIKALDREQQLDIKIITNGVQSINGDDMVNPYAASIIGLARSAVKEYPNLRMSLIDIDINDIEKNQFIEHIIKEPFEKEPLEVAFRQNSRYEKILKKAEINNNPSISFRKNGVYMIIGGAGGIGSEMSFYLSKRFQAKIVLVGRSELTSAQQEKLRQIEDAGGEVLYLQADVSNVEEMEKVVQLAEAKFQVLHGVVHSAIVLDDGAIENMQEKTIRKVFNPKVIGSVILHKVLKEKKLDFMLYFSSAQSFNPAAGQSNYAAASRFEDAIAQYYSSEFYPTWIINWGYWGTVGVVASEKYRERLAAGGLYPLEVQEGMEAIMRIVGNNIQQVMVIKGSENFLKYMGVVRDSATEKTIYNDDIKKEQIVSINLDQQLVKKEKQEYFEEMSSKISVSNNKSIYSHVKESIIAGITTVLGVKEKDIDTSRQFSDYGVDSITGLELIKYINDNLSLSLRTTIIFDYANVEKLTDYIIGQHNNDLIY